MPPNPFCFLCFTNPQNEKHNMDKSYDLGKN